MTITCFILKNEWENKREKIQEKFNIDVLWSLKRDLKDCTLFIVWVVGDC